MIGNVWEWCKDADSEIYYADVSKRGVAVDPFCSKGTPSRVAQRRQLWSCEPVSQPEARAVVRCSRGSGELRRELLAEPAQQERGRIDAHPEREDDGRLFVIRAEERRGGGHGQ